MPSDLDERIAAQPSQEVSHGIISSKVFAHGLDPGAPFPSQHRYDLTTGEQPDLVPIHILDWKQLVGCTSKTPPAETTARTILAAAGAIAPARGPEGVLRRKGIRFPFTRGVANGVG
jgi:hypothetical protein